MSSFCGEALCVQNFRKLQLHLKVHFPTAPLDRSTEPIQESAGAVRGATATKGAGTEPAKNKFAQNLHVLPTAPPYAANLLHSKVKLQEKGPRKLQLSFCSDGVRLVPSPWKKHVPGPRKVQFN